MRYKAITYNQQEFEIELRITGKFIIINPINKDDKPITLGGAYDELFDKGVMKFRLDNMCKHCVRDWGDGTYTFYALRAGDPLYVEPVKEQK